MLLFVTLQVFEIFEGLIFLGENNPHLYLSHVVSGLSSRCEV